MKPVRGMVTLPPSCGNPARSKIFSLSTPSNPASRSTAKGGRPCKARRRRPQAPPSPKRRSRLRCRAARAGAALAAQAEAVRREAEQRAVVEDETLVVAPRGIVDASGLQLRYVAQGEPVAEASASGPSMRYFTIGEMSNRAAWLRMAKYSSLLVPQRVRGAVAGPVVPFAGPASASMRGWNGVPSRSVRKWD